MVIDADGLVTIALRAVRLGVPLTAGPHDGAVVIPPRVYDDGSPITFHQTSVVLRALGCMPGVGPVTVEVGADEQGRAWELVLYEGHAAPDDWPGGGAGQPVGRLIDPSGAPLSLARRRRWSYGVEPGDVPEEAALAGLARLTPVFGWFVSRVLIAADAAASAN